MMQASMGLDGGARTLSARTHGDKRRAARRGVDLACELVAQGSEAPELRWATDLSPFGLWLEAAEPLRPGETVVVCLEPPVWWPRGRELMVFAGVTRAGWGRRNADRGATGMGLDFIDLSDHERRVLTTWLSWRPVLPRRRFGAPARTAMRTRSAAPELAARAPLAAPKPPAWPNDVRSVRSVRECAHLPLHLPAMEAPLPRVSARIEPVLEAAGPVVRLDAAFAWELDAGEPGGLACDEDSASWGGR